ncbi:PREDICTED: sensory neuron membrane protein 2-like [Nicrophorus vespilloides]|uniref:Sensory neuron membrane protein 2 n=1 Tax=Nicrophorus vespilloides TaxID=110193 RepID=A0ABM1N4X1_NICVS|nr:PREDICTED: sensory neuron membrane protein 2-like [Nicrophorus vespilloides]
MLKTRKQRCTFITSVVAVVLLFVTLLLATYGIPTIVTDVMESNLRLEDGSMAWDVFEEVPFPLDFKIYFFEVENTDKMLTGEEAPKLREIGPYVYNERRYKTGIKLDGDLVEYRQRQDFSFDRERTDDSLTPDDKITTINPLVWGIYQYMESTGMKLPLDLKSALSQILDESELIQKLVVKDILFGGIPFCDPAKTKWEGKLLCLVFMFMNVKVVEYKDDGSMIYSLLRFKSETDDGLYVAKRGIDDISQIGKIMSWNGLTSVDFWPGGEEASCNKVEGRDISIYPPYIKKGETFKLYASDMCRTAEIIFDGEGTYKDLDTYDYVVNKRLFYPEDGEKAEDSCYCAKKTRGMDGEESCFLDGALDVQTCFGMPALLSLPHFLYADKKYLDAVENLKPDIEKHNLVMRLQPLLGFPVVGNRRIQMNMVVRPMLYGGEMIEETAKVSRSLLPLMWFDEGIELNNYYYDLLDVALYVMKVADIIKWVLVGLAAIMLLISGSFYIYFWRTGR